MEEGSWTLDYLVWLTKILASSSWHPEDKFKNRLFRFRQWQWQQMESSLMSREKLIYGLGLSPKAIQLQDPRERQSMMLLLVAAFLKKQQQRSGS